MLFKPLLVLAGLLAAQSARADILLTFNGAVGPDTFSFETILATFPTTGIDLTNSLVTTSANAPVGFQTVNIQNPATSQFTVVVLFRPGFPDGIRGFQPDFNGPFDKVGTYSFLTSNSSASLVVTDFVRPTTTPEPASAGLILLTGLGGFVAFKKRLLPVRI